MDLLLIVSRILHVLAAITLLGGAIFTRMALLPATKDLPEETHANLQETLRKKWVMFVMLAITVLMLTGFYNFVVDAIPNHKGDKHYHMLMGIKILLAFVVFFIASALSGRSTGLAWIRQNRGKWLMITIALGTIIVSIAGYLKVRGGML